jgi:hypothetical protein
MAAVAEDRARRWEQSGVTGPGFGRVPGRDGGRVVSVTPGGGQGPGQAGWWLRGAAAALGVLAGAAAAVSWDAQYTMVRAARHVPVVAALEAGIPDVGAVIFAALGVALALHGKRAVRPRALNVACIGISLVMNALAAGRGWRDLVIWVMPAGVYALASDTLIGVVRAWVLALARNQGEMLAEDGPTPLALAGNLVLWLLRLSLAPRSTLAGFRSWVVTDCPVAPGLRPGHVAGLEAVRQEAAERIALAGCQRDEDVGRAIGEARQAREEAMRARAAETAVRAELDRTRADANQMLTRALAGAAREQAELRAGSQAQADGLRAELRQARDGAARLAEQVRDASAARVAVVEEARAGLRAERDQLAADLRAAYQPPRGGGRAPRARDARGPRGSGATKRDQMIELAGQRRDLASVPLREVSGLASTVAGEIGYSPGTARRELVRHVRELQAASAGSTPQGEGGEAR